MSKAVLSVILGVLVFGAPQAVLAGQSASAGGRLSAGRMASAELITARAAQQMQRMCDAMFSDCNTEVLGPLQAAAADHHLSDEERAALGAKGLDFIDYRLGTSVQEINRIADRALVDIARIPGDHALQVALIGDARRYSLWLAGATSEHFSSTVVDFLGL